MKHKVEMQQEDTYRGQPLRLSYKGREYRFQVLRKGLRKEDREIKILLDGHTHLLCLKEGKWSFALAVGDQTLAQEIYRAISLRYRL